MTRHGIGAYVEHCVLIMLILNILCIMFGSRSWRSANLSDTQVIDNVTIRQYKVLSLVYKVVISAVLRFCWIYVGNNIRREISFLMMDI